MIDNRAGKMYGWLQSQIVEAVSSIDSNPNRTVKILKSMYEQIQYERDDRAALLAQTIPSTEQQEEDKWSGEGIA